MRRVDEIREFEHLQQVALLLEKENERLHLRLKEQTTELAELRGQEHVEALQLELTKLTAELARRGRKSGWNTSERRPRKKTRTEGQDKPRPGHGPTPQLELPRRIEEHILGPDERCCPACEGTLDEWVGQFEDAEEITSIERRFEVVVHRRQKYRCRCNGAVVTAPPPSKLIPGGRYSVEFAVAVALAKYLEHMPLARQAASMTRSGLTVTTQTLWDQIDALTKLLSPSLAALKASILSSQVVHADETWWRLMNSASPKNWWTWCLRVPDAVLYTMLPTRGNDSARTLLADFKGILMADAYVVYRSLARDGPQRLGFTLVHCWVHARRKFIEIEANYTSQCKQVLDLIGQLYLIEREAQEAGDAESVEAERRRLRHTKSRRVVADIKEWAIGQPCSPESDLRKAINYMLKIWPELTRFLDDPRIPLDNNDAEQALRGPVLGRRNHYGSRSERGLEVAATMYSLLQTAKLCGVDPARYLAAAVRAELTRPGTALLPRDLVG